MTPAPGWGPGWWQSVKVTSPPDRDAPKKEGRAFLNYAQDFPNTRGAPEVAWVPPDVVFPGSHASVSGSGLYSLISNQKREPRPGALVTPKVAWWRVRMWRTMLRPMPEPMTARLWEERDL